MEAAGAGTGETDVIETACVNERAFGTDAAKTAADRTEETAVTEEAEVTKTGVVSGTVENEEAKAAAVVTEEAKVTKADVVSGAAETKAAYGIEEIVVTEEAEVGVVSGAAETEAGHGIEAEVVTKTMIETGDVTRSIVNVLAAYVHEEWAVVVQKRPSSHYHERMPVLMRVVCKMLSAMWPERRGSVCLERVASGARIEQVSVTGSLQ